MHIKKGDKVKIITGSARGKTSKVLRVLNETGRVVVEGVNIRTRHSRPRREKEKGQKIEFPAPIASSNVMLVCSKCDKTSRASKIILEDGQRVRRCKKCGEMI